MEATKTTVFSQIEETIVNLSETISDNRKEVLQPLIDYIQQGVNNNELINLNFICTHNSRRSHLSQIWAQTMAYYLNIPNVYCYSGGTEATAMNKNVVTTLEQQGFKIQSLSETANPVYAVKFSENTQPVIGFSKKYDHEFNPVNEFCAIMTCSQADEGCPFIAGANKRVPVTYEDPKAFDNTPLEKEKYAERSLEIASEMLYIFKSIK
ncbi:protein-tyrosine-phosphatase [uncultured Tenacibaculum sp.]|uniref:arsenate-mycothiol transferase ArsC n=1 Tax=uncultured Tenacibaculum sp. TaxID=174713 RepID=UPI002601F0FA|nr:protein-tyrosine-phosphatase [uncultured Tenacibaculum sp.]